MKPNINKITLKDDNENVYRADIPTYGLFTGSITIQFHWKDGKLLKAKIVKENTIEVIKSEL